MGWIPLTVAVLAAIAAVLVVWMDWESHPLDRPQENEDRRNAG